MLGFPSAHGFGAGMNGYRNWRMCLQAELQRRFCISIEDCLDESLLLGFYHGGESPVYVADWLKNKRELIEL